MAMRSTTSIKINPTIWKKAKLKSVRKGIDLSEYIEFLIKKDMRKPKKV